MKLQILHAPTVTLRLYSCIFQTWVAYSPLCYCRNHLILLCDAFPTTRPTSDLEVICYQILLWSYWTYTNTQLWSSIDHIGYDLLIHRCLLLETNCFQI